MCQSELRNDFEKTAHNPESWFVTGYGVLCGHEFTVKEGASHLVHDLDNSREECVPATGEAVRSALDLARVRVEVLVGCKVTNPQWGYLFIQLTEEGLQVWCQFSVIGQRL